MLTIIGCGNLNRSDDGVGVRLAQKLGERLRRHPVPGIQVFDCGTAGVDVMFKARGSDALLIIDAARTGDVPGTVFDVPGDELRQEHQPTFSLHDFRWDHALSAGRRIFKDDFPDDVRVWLIEVSTVEYGIELSQPVEAALEKVYRRALTLIAEHAVRRHPAGQDVSLELHQGSIRISVAVYEAYFDGREGALLMERDGEMWIVPVDQADGGVLVKQRNRVGDRVIDAREFFALRRIEAAHGHLPARWDSELGALCVPIPSPEEQGAQRT
ncbi:MAG: hydrogenase maturation protease [Myxococcota bacterium]